MDREKIQSKIDKLSKEAKELMERKQAIQQELGFIRDRLVAIEGGIATLVDLIREESSDEN